MGLVRGLLGEGRFERAAFTATALYVLTAFPGIPACLLPLHAGERTLVRAEARV